jgi:hypothetical protein
MKKAALFVILLSLSTGFNHAQILSLDPTREVSAQFEGEIQDSDVFFEAGVYRMAVTFGNPENPPFAAASQDSLLVWSASQLSMIGTLGARALGGDVTGGRSSFSLDFEIAERLPYFFEATATQTDSATLRGSLIGITPSQEIFDHFFVDGQVLSGSGFLDAGVYFVSFDLFVTGSELLPEQTAELEFSFQVVPEPESYAVAFGILCLVALGCRRAWARA